MSMLLGAFQLLNPNGTVGVSWRHPDNTSLDYLSIDYWTGIARILEDLSLIHISEPTRPY